MLPEKSPCYSQDMMMVEGTDRFINYFEKSGLRTEAVRFKKNTGTSTCTMVSKIFKVKNTDTQAHIYLEPVL